MNKMGMKLYNMVIACIASESVILETDIDKTIDELKRFPGFTEITEPEIDEIRIRVKSECSIKLDKGDLITAKGHEKWFLARKADLNMEYWERYRKYLLGDKHFPIDVVNTMDDILDSLTDLIGDPENKKSFERRGLIIGDVQSGKTANYSGLICKGADVGFKVIVLLTGTIEKLRRQTQQRLDEGFVGFDSDAMVKMKDEGIWIGVGKYNRSFSPMVLTSTNDDFKAQNAKNLGFNLKAINGPALFVIKKNVTILKRLNKWLKTLNKDSEDKINHSILVIDDESDNASVNTNPEDRDPTAINLQIRSLLGMFDKSSYVGYTATPFANIFIDPDTEASMEHEDLFPKDFIYSLNAPPNYIGARNIFGDVAEHEYMLCEIDTDEATELSIESCIPLKHKSDFIVEDLPTDLETSINVFVLANTIRDIRGHAKSHRSMLINVSRFTNVQSQIATKVNSYLKTLQHSCRINGLLSEKDAIRDMHIMRLKNTFDEIYSGINIEWETIQNALHKAISPIHVVTINQKSTKTLNYDEYEGEGMRVIAVGGLSLSRGLTLEGLVTSYFYRNSKMYDTLMQMGRWFGYRPGYEDLCRIWMSESSIEWYNHISNATDELREDICRYQYSDMTPLDFGLRVRSDLDTLLVTARNKMRSAKDLICNVSLSGDVIETPELFADYVKNSSNLDVIKMLFLRAKEDGLCFKKERNNYGIHNVKKDRIIDFLEAYDVMPSNYKFNTEMLVDFIQGYAGNELDYWDIAIASGSYDEEPYELEQGKTTKLVVRSFELSDNGRVVKINGAKRRLGTSADGKFGLSSEVISEIESRTEKSTSQKEYFKGVSRKPLLTVYFVQLNGKEQNMKSIDWIKDGMPLVGIGIGIPELSDIKTKYVRYMMNKIEAQQILGWDTNVEIGDED